MKEHVTNFTVHLRAAIEIAEKSVLKEPGSAINNVVVIGLGGSGIGGTIVSHVLSQEMKVPLISCKDYNIPAFVSANSLVIASSYSGNTEETMNALEQAASRTKNIYCICSGGKIQELATQRGFSCIVIPGGLPPRGAFGYSFPQLFATLKAGKLIDWDLRAEFQRAVKLLEEESKDIQKLAMDLARDLKDKRIIIYSESNYEGVGVRFRQQINENSKKLCWHHVIPEMNHNELVGWRESNEDLAVVFLRNTADFQRNQRRFDLSGEIISKYTPNVHEIWSKGKTMLDRSLYLIHLTDWISVNIAELNGTDPIEIDVINFLKGELAKS
ncbi:MAG: bifunctional phosphoglucose/phosphomannose isomerase [Vicingaceae bacterium]